MLESFNLKNYTDLEDLRRDLTRIERDFTSLSNEIQKSRTLLATARIVLAVKLRGDNVVAPVRTGPEKGYDLVKTKKLYTAVEELKDRLDVLNNMIPQLKSRFSADKIAERILKDAETLRTNINKQLKQSYQEAGEHAEEIVPSAFKRYAERFQNKLKDRFKGRFSKMSDAPLFMVAPSTTKGVLLYVAYIRFSNLQDDNGYTHEKYYITIGVEVAPTGNLKYMLAVNDRMVLPNRIKWVGAVDESKMFTKLSDVVQAMQPHRMEKLEELLNVQLKTDHMVSKMHPRKLPIDEEKIKFDHSSIMNVQVKDEVITIKLNPKVGSNQIDEIRGLLRSHLRGIILQDKPRNKDVIVDRLYKKGSNWYLEFKLQIPMNYHGISISKPEWLYLKHQFGFSEEQLRDLQAAMDETSPQG